MMKGKSPCHADGALLTELVKARMRKSRRTANGMNLAGLIPGHYLTLLSDLRDSVLYFGTSYFSPSACAVCVYHVLFVSSLWCKSTSLSVRQCVTPRLRVVTHPHNFRFYPELLACDLSHIMHNEPLPRRSRLVLQWVLLGSTKALCCVERASRRERAKANFPSLQ